jgi:aconitate hydratase
MVRGTFANIRLRNLLGGAAREPLPEGGFTRYLADDRPSRCRSTTPRCATRRRACRWWCSAARSTVGLLARLGGQGHEAARRARRDRRELRAHPPLEPGRHGRAAAAVPRGERRLARADRRGAAPLAAGERPALATVTADGRSFQARVRIDTPMEVEYYRHGGILQYVLRQLLAS